MIKKISVFVLVLIFLFALTGCDSLPGTSTQDGSGELALNIADKPVNNVDKVLVTIKEVQVVKEDSSVETINDFEDEENNEKQFDLMTLRFDKELLGQKRLDAGLYNQIRLIVAANEQDKNPTTMGKTKVVYKNGEEENIFIPSGTKTGLKINHNFEVREDAITELTLDVEVDKFMHEAGNSGKIILKPTAISIIDEVVSGSILGKVVDNEGNAITDKDVKIEAYDSGNDMATTEPVKSTLATVEPTEKRDAGSFLIRNLKEGNYDLKAYTIVDENGEMVEGSLSGIIEDIKVEKEKTTELNENIVLK